LHATDDVLSLTTVDTSQTILQTRYNAIHYNANSIITWYQSWLTIIRGHSFRRRLGTACQANVITLLFWRAVYFVLHASQSAAMEHLETSVPQQRKKRNKAEQLYQLHLMVSVYRVVA